MFQKYPKHRNAYIKTFEKMMPNYKYKDCFENAEEMFEQWISDYTIKQWEGNKKQMKIKFV